MEQQSRRRRHKIALVPIELLKPHEQVIEEHVRALAEDIASRGILIRPILVDSKTFTILDGHHRVEALRRLGARYVPAIVVDYDRDDEVEVTSWRPGVVVTKDMVRRAALSRRLMPPKTSRHVTKFEVPDVNMPVERLGVKVDRR
ncbi:MAG: ParB N-terminal domain-containing protein [Thermoproteota archaeon]